MKNKYLITLIFIIFQYSVFSQKGIIKGVVNDAETSETLIGANVLIGDGVGTITDFDGNFELEVKPGDYEVKVSYVGYEPKTKKVTVGDKPVYLKFRMESITLNEVMVVADVARARETPVAFATVLPQQIEEEKGAQDLPMVLNSTPGVYATQTGGGDGDAQVRIRGFKNNNVGTMLDGIPVNDMENGRVYWSNWFGLSLVTRAMQVQRGLSASKLALPSVGGTVNIITKGIEDKREVSLEEMITSEGKSQTSFGYNSGLFDNGVGFTLAGAYKTGSGWVDHTDVKAYFYYVKIYKRFDKHTLNISAMGAPQRHEQRKYSKPIATYDTTMAKEMGLTNSNFPVLKNGTLPLNLGYNYNQHWGYLKRDRYNENAAPEVLHEAVNEYYKPMFSIRDFWSVNEKFSVSNIAYLSIGRGGGTAFRGTGYTSNNLDSTGQINWQHFYSENTDSIYGAFGLINNPIDDFYSDTEFKSRNIIYEQVNEHFWFGFLSTFNYKPNNLFTFSGGIDLRRYKGTHFSKILDLLGGDYYIDANDSRIDYTVNPKLKMNREGDKIFWYDDAYVNWGGLFTQAEFKTGLLSTFANLTGYYTGHRKDDYFNDGYSDWIWIPGFTFKAGANYNATEHQNVFMNLGYLSKVKEASYIYVGHTPNFADDISNEKVKALELGYSLHFPRFASNVNLYHTSWINMPLTIYSRYEDQNTIGTVNNMAKRHKGIEFDFAYSINNKIELEGLASIGDWIWNENVSLQMYFSNNPDSAANIQDLPLKGIHSSDAAQTQFALSLKVEPIERSYIKARYTYFERYYADFNAESIIDRKTNEPRESWQIPSYSFLDLFVGYKFKMPNFNKFKIRLSFNVYNVLNVMYISDARNNDTYSYIPEGTKENFDAASASVFFGQGRRFTTSLKITF